MKVLIALALLLPALQDVPDRYRIRLFIQAENKHNMGTILKRYLSDLPGILSMDYDSNTESIALTMEADAFLTKEEIEEELPRIYNVRRFDVEELQEP